jgi:hypothetical protein
MKNSLPETMLDNTLAERAMAILSGKTKHLNKLNTEIKRLRIEVMKSNSNSPTNQPNRRRQQ